MQKTPEQLQIFADIKEESTCSPEASHASLSVLPGSKRARRMTDISGHILSKSLKRSDPAGVCLKMLLESSIWHSTRCYLKWKRRVTKQQRVLYQLVPSMPRTEEIESGLLPTASAWDGMRGPAREYDPKSKSQKDRNLNTYARVFPNHVQKINSAMWPTPREFMHKDAKYDKGKSNLGEVVMAVNETERLLPTPQSNEDAAGTPDGKMQKMLGNHPDVRQDPNGGVLNPTWVEWLMGWPLGFTDLKPLVMDKFLCAPQQHGSF